MCGIFGFTSYGNGKGVNLIGLTASLARESTERGIDATGIAYAENGRIIIKKTNKSAYLADLKHPENIKALIGHTRHATHGAPAKNFNNHPFFGRAGRDKFALAHNGVLFNAGELRKSNALPKTKVETDSFVAVQLIEKAKSLDPKNLAYMAEKVWGSFCFNILDDKNNTYLIKGDNPLVLLHFKAQGLYVYASTEEILWRSLIGTSLFASLKAGDYEEIPLKEGDILKINDRGVCSLSRFDYFDYNEPYRGMYTTYNYPFYETEEEEDYFESIKKAAIFEGFDSLFIDNLRDEGFSLDEISDFVLPGRDFMEV